MMPYLPHNTILGGLIIDEVFEFYDIPRLFSCHSTTDQRYIVVSANQDSEKITWLYAPVSKRRLEYIMSGGIDLKSAFLNTESGFLTIVESFFSGSFELQQSSPRLIPVEWLPLDGEYLSIEMHNQVEQRQDLAEYSKQTNRETLSVIIKNPSQRRTEAPARAIGSILNALQELVDALAQYAHGIPTIKGPIPATITQRAQLNLSGVFDGSFGIQLIASDEADLFKDSLVRNSILHFSELLEIKDDMDKLVPMLTELKPRAATKYEKFLESILKSDSPIIVEHGSPKDLNTVIYKIDRPTIGSILENVKRININLAEEIVISGTLLGLNIRSMNFEIEELGSNTNYKGSIAKDCDDSVLHGRINDKYMASIKQLIEVKSSTGEERVRNIITKLTPLSIAQIETDR